MARKGAITLQEALCIYYCFIYAKPLYSACSYMSNKRISVISSGGCDGGRLWCWLARFLNQRERWKPVSRTLESPTSRLFIPRRVLANLPSNGPH